MGISMLVRQHLYVKFSPMLSLSWCCFNHHQCHTVINSNLTKMQMVVYYFYSKWGVNFFFGKQMVNFEADEAVNEILSNYFVIISDIIRSLPHDIILLSVNKFKKFLYFNWFCLQDPWKLFFFTIDSCKECRVSLKHGFCINIKTAFSGTGIPIIKIKVAYSVVYILYMQYIDIFVLWQWI